MFEKIFCSSLLLIALLNITHAQSPCTTTDASGCICPDGTTDCDLLPDLKAGDDPLLVTGSQGVIEFSQSGNGSDDGRLRVSVTTPNIGFGPLEVHAVDIFICGTDTFLTFPGTCPDGSDPRQLINQRIFHKSGNTMTYYDRPAGAMTYHPTHGHMHVDEWGFYTLRLEQAGNPNPLEWPVIGNGSKLAFCLMDYGTCDYYNGHCESDTGTILTTPDFPNFGLGGGAYSCSAVVQGISSGFTDIYYQHLDGMWVDIPPTTCNGDYYLVVEIDPHNYFLEATDTNNWMAVPITLTEQLPNLSAPFAEIQAHDTTYLCSGETLNLKANAGYSYQWSTGAITQSIDVTLPGNYSVIVNSPCGIDTSDVVTVIALPGVSQPTVTTPAAVCDSASFLITGIGNETLVWYDQASGGNLVDTGSSFQTPTIHQTTTYYVADAIIKSGKKSMVGPFDNNIGGGGYYTGDQHLIFDVKNPCVIASVKVFADGAGLRTIQLRNSLGAVLKSVQANVPDGESRVDLNFDVPTGLNFQLGWASGSSPDLYRNDGGVNYPYEVSNLLTIKSSSAGADYYYCFYDWEVRPGDKICESARIPVTAEIMSATVPSFSGLAITYFDTDGAATLSGTPAGGIFSGPGVSGNQFDPSIAGAGVHDISYTYTDQNGCSKTTNQTTEVEEYTGISSILIAGLINVHPNPNFGVFFISIPEGCEGSCKFELLESTGRKLDEVLFEQSTVNNEMKFTVSQSGLYILRAVNSNGTWTGKVLVY